MTSASLTDLACAPRALAAASLALALLGTGCATPERGGFSREALHAQIERVGQNVDNRGHVLEFEYEDVRIACISDAVHDRMRLIVPIVKVETLEAVQLQILLVANFHTTLDARYAVSEEIVYAAFLHPLSTLTPEQLDSALRQVAALARNFGSTYSSDELLYGAAAGEEA